MLKNNRMKQLILLLLTGFSIGTLCAQQSDEAANRALEREVKTSGNYLYGEAVANTKEEAADMAKTALASEIHNEHLLQGAAFSQTQDEEYNTNIIELMRGNKFRVIAYIKKDDIAVSNNETPKIAPVSNNETPETVAANPANTGSVLDKIINASSIYEVQKIFNENKRTGKVVSGTMDKLITPENAYLIVYKNTGEIVAILDKGSAANRKDLLSGETKGDEILEENQIIWFQLF